jgi:hypothetical protein
MAYNSNIPLAGDAISLSQDQILGNFTSLGGMLRPDTFTMVLERQPAPPATTATQVAVYAKDSLLHATETPAVLNKPEMFVMLNSSSFDNDMTSCKKDALDPKQKGYTSLPSGIILQWGYDNLGAALTPITYTIPFPTFVACITATQYDTTGDSGVRAVIGVQDIALNTFNAGAKRVGVAGYEAADIYWFAIGW